MTEEDYDRFVAALERMRQRQEQYEVDSRQRQEQYEVESRQRDERREADWKRRWDQFEAELRRSREEFDAKLANMNQFLMNIASTHAEHHAEMRARYEEAMRRLDRDEEDMRQMRAETRLLRREGVRLVREIRATQETLRAFIDSLRRGGDGHGPVQ